MRQIDLNGQWFVKVIDKRNTLPAHYERVLEWNPATVPGTIHTDLLNENIIIDPYYRMNELHVQWIENYQWLYRREFTVDKSIIDEESIILDAQGLDTYAKISINGKKVGHTENMFVYHQFDIKRFLTSGVNTIEILFDSPVARSKALQKKHGILEVALESHRVYARKAQYSFGWDWGPKLTTSGIWRPISIKASSGPILKNQFVKTIDLTEKTATVEISMNIENFKFPLDISVKIEGEGYSEEIKKRVVSSHVTLRRKIDHPHLWWPNGYGSQPLYTVTSTIQDSDGSTSETSTTFGIRTVKLVQEKDAEGKSFVIQVNGVNIFCKGADWIPCDNFIPRIPDSTYERLVTLAQNANMNMLRVWGGGIYEQDIFYELCDKFGLLIWQDFMFACGEYPQTKWFINSVKEEAAKLVMRLRNHPSIAIWCGNNECEWLYCTQHPDKSADDMKGSRIFREVLPNIVTQLDGSRPYWRSSPYGAGFPNDVSNGTHHEWNVWSFWKDYKEYEKVTARFVSEFGFQAPANSTTWAEVTLPADRHPQHPVIEHHNKQVEGQERLFRFQSAHYTVGSGFEDFLYQGQLVQANALKTAVEHWRRRKFKTSGALFWQLNDCWPVSSWAVVDSSLRPKAAYYYSRRFFAPVLVSISSQENILTVWGTNDLRKTVKANLTVKVISFDGKVVFAAAQEVSLRMNSSEKLYTIPAQTFHSIEKNSHFVSVQLTFHGDLISENRYYFVEPKHMAVRVPQLTADIITAEGAYLNLSIHTDVLAKDIRIELEGCDIDLEDNYFDLDPGSSRLIRCTLLGGASAAGKKIVVKSLTEGTM